MSRTASPYIVPVHDLIRRPGESRELALEFAAPARLGEALIAVEEGASIAIDGRLDSIHEGVLVAARAQATAVGECGRCLGPVSEDLDVDVTELFAYPSEEEFDFHIHEEQVDLEELVRDAIVLALPFQPVCRPDCPGLDPETGARLEDHPELANREQLDPRWGALAGFQAERDEADTER